LAFSTGTISRRLAEDAVSRALQHKTSYYDFFFTTTTVNPTDLNPAVYDENTRVHTIDIIAAAADRYNIYHYNIYIYI